MVVIAHQNKGVQDETEAICHFFQQGAKIPPVGVVPVNVITLNCRALSHDTSHQLVPLEEAAPWC